jgi:hypothetical protein
MGIQFRMPSVPGCHSSNMSLKTSHARCHLGFSGVLESGNEALPRCNSSYDCPLGQWCDAYYTSGAFAGECVPAC